MGESGSRGNPQDARDPKDIPVDERYYFLEERYPEYGNLVPRDIATREIFDICTTDGLSVEKDRLCVYLDLTHIPRETLDRKLGGILEIYEKFQGVDPRNAPMKIFPAVHYSMGGLWVDYEKSENGGLVEGSPRNQQTNIQGLYAIGECDYQYHGANRLGANSLSVIAFSVVFSVHQALSLVVRKILVMRQVQTLLPQSRNRKKFTKQFCLDPQGNRILTIFIDNSVT